MRRSLTGPLAGALTVGGLLLITAAWLAVAGHGGIGDPVYRLALEFGPADAPPAAPKPEEPATPVRLVEGTPVADPALLERSRDGHLLPRIAADGRKPLQVYGQAFAADGRPRIAVVVTGLGLSSEATTAVLQGLPPAVTLAFSPYTSDLQGVVDRARARGQEVLIELPMEPFGFPQDDPGPLALRAALTGSDNLTRLGTVMGRATGYVGLATFQGGRFLASEAALDPVAEDAARRGLVLFDSGTEEGSLLASRAQGAGAAHAAAARALEGLTDPATIDDALLAVERVASAEGRASVSLRPVPVAIDRVQRWIATFESRGFALAPLTAVVEAGTLPETPETVRDAPPAP